MKSLGSWLITIFLIVFWAFRIVVTISAQMGTVFVVSPLNVNTEIILLFVVLICIPFIFKRKIIGAIAVLGVYGWYFGPDLVAKITSVFAGNTTSLNIYIEILVEAIAIALPLFSIFDILLDKNRTKNPIHKDTDWFYKNEEYDRKLDDRADKNNYRTGL